MSFRFSVGDHVRVIGEDFATGEYGEVTIIEYTPDGSEFDQAEYTIEFDDPIPNSNYQGNEEWELPSFTQGYFNDDELEFADKKKRPKRVSGFGRFISDIESRHEATPINRIEDAN